MNGLNVSFYKSVGERASADFSRWNTDGAKAYSKIVDQIGSLPLGDPKVIDQRLHSPVGICAFIGTVVGFIVGIISLLRVIQQLNR